MNKVILILLFFSVFLVGCSSVNNETKETFEEYKSNGKWISCMPILETEEEQKLCEYAHEQGYDKIAN